MPRASDDHYFVFVFFLPVLPKTARPTLGHTTRPFPSEPLRFEESGTQLRVSASVELAIHWRLYAIKDFRIV